MDYLHSQSAVSIDNMTDENDELSLTPRLNEETSTSSKAQVIDFLFVFILFLSKTIDQFKYPRAYTSAYLSILHSVQYHW